MLRGPDRNKANLPPRNLNRLDESYVKEERLNPGTNSGGPLMSSGGWLPSNLPAQCSTISRRCCGHPARIAPSLPGLAVGGVPAGRFAGHLETPVDSEHFAETVVEILERAGGTS
jgi:hypothetical protein